MNQQYSDRIVLFLAGGVLILLQGLIIRELSAALISCELTILVVTAAYWSGISLGYALSKVLTDRWAKHLALATLVVQCGLCLVRLWPLAGLWLGLRGWWVLLWLYVLALPLPLLYSTILPRYIARREPEALSYAYRIELLGALVGLVLLGSLSLTTGPWLWLVYLGCVMCLTCLLVPSKRTQVLITLLFLVYVPFAAKIQRWQTVQFYGYLKHVAVQEVIHSSDSLYQKVELIQDEQGEIRCFLNGLEYFNSKELETFNLLLSGLPAKLMKPKDVLIVGSGSMSSVAHVNPYTQSITTVEIDRRVYDVGRRYLTAFNRLDQIRNHRLIVDDAKHFLRSTDETFDLIVMDLPAPIYIQTGLLYTQEFYALVRSRLRPGGAVALYASGWFVERNPISRQVVAGVAAVFPEFYVVSEFSRGLTFVVAGEQLSFTEHDIAREITAWLPEDKVWIYTRERALSDIIRDAQPLSLRRPRAILKVNEWLLEQMWNPSPVTWVPTS